MPVRVTRRHQMPPDELETLLAAQSGSCGACRDALAADAAVVDRDGGEVRGLLCAACARVAAAGEPTVVRAVADYLDGGGDGG